MVNQVAMYCLSGLIIILGGISLFVQKVYKVGEDSQEKTVVELPFFGKLTTNYPAIAFAFIGAAIAVFALSKASGGFNQWLVEGRFEAPPARAINWCDGIITLEPRKLTPEVKPDGSFTISGVIVRGGTFESEVRQITYTHKECTGTIRVDQEYCNFVEKKGSSLDFVDETTRRYKPVLVHFYPKTESEVAP